MRRVRRVLGVAGLAAAGFGAFAVLTTAADSTEPPETTAMAAVRANPQAFFDSYCGTCHSERMHTAGLVLEKAALSPIGPNAEVWEKVIAKLHAGEMPPSTTKKQPTPEEVKAMVAYLTSSMDTFAASNVRPGRPVVRRLTRVEYSNAVRDLLAIDLDPGDSLPPDVVAYSFNNNGDALSLSPLLLDKYLRVSRQVVRLATSDPSLPKALYRYPQPDRLNDWYQNQPPDKQSVWRSGVPFGANGGYSFRYYFPASGDYDIRVFLGSTVIPNSNSAIGHRTFSYRVSVPAGSHEVAAMVASEHTLPEGPIQQYDGKAGALGGPIDPLVTSGKLPLLDLRLDGKRLQRFEVKPTSLIDLETPNGTNPGMPAIRLVEVEGPYNPSGPAQTPSRKRIFVCQPASAKDEAPCARKILTTVARRAYRRDVADSDVKPLMAVYDKARVKGDFEAGIREALQAVLVSPQFLYRVEKDPPKAKAGQVYKVNDFDLASRLSFFLWSSIPDDQLLDAARAGKLRNADVMNREIARMLADRKADALVENFGMQYLGLHDLETMRPSKARYPKFNVTLRNEMMDESRLFMRSIIRENRSVTDLVNANYSYLNADLAKYYGVQGVYGDQFRRVTFPAGERRGGVLTQGSVLMVTSHEDITSPVLRGKWVLTNLLNQPPPSPPPNIPAIVATDPAGRPLTGREQLEQHRKSPVCASCHTRMDPFGLSMENFDVTGAWRVNDEGGKVNPVVNLPDGSGWDGVDGLKKRLASNPQDLATAFTGRLMVYALGRRLEGADQATLREIVRKAAPGGYRFNDLLNGVVESPQFKMRRKDV